MAESWVRDILDFWFSLQPEQWWKSTPELDSEISERFLDIWQEQQQRLTTDFLGDADTALAAIILFDQFPRNMFRGHADSFATDHMALAIAKGAIDLGYDETFEQPRRGFVYIPFQHSEDMADQRRALLLFTALADEHQLRYAHRHHDVIARFGRFPSRNDALGREWRPEERAAGDVDPTHL